ncbi:MAG: Abi family protein [Clostridiaceae bacterium]|nr:Abi family protein [Clostridiaceae bacterium]
MRTYNKPVLTFEEQIDLLEKRGLIIPDKARTKRHLSNVSYYRMSAYMLPYRIIDQNGNRLDQFKAGATWDDVYNLYKFDRKLRLLVFDAIERIEIALRTQMIYQLSHKYGSHWQDNSKIFKASKANRYNVFTDIQNHITNQLNANKKVPFIEHYLKTYDNPPTPPSWMSVELLYFSELSKICNNLVNRDDRTNISKAFGVKDDTVFCSWLHTLSYVRNICAHHARLWNIRMDITPTKYINKDPNKVWFTQAEVQSVQNSKLYYTLCLILYLLQTVNPKTNFRIHFKNLLIKYPNVNVGQMGFPSDWIDHPLWRDSK